MLSPFLAGSSALRSRLSRSSSSFSSRSFLLLILFNSLFSSLGIYNFDFSGSSNSEKKYSTAAKKIRVADANKQGGREAKKTNFEFFLGEKKKIQVEKKNNVNMMNCVRKKIMEARSKVKHSPDSKDTKPLKSILSRRIFKILFFFRFVQKDIILQPLARVCPLGIRFIKIYFTI